MPSSVNVLAGMRAVWVPIFFILTLPVVTKFLHMVLTNVKVTSVRNGNARKYLQFLKFLAFGSMFVNIFFLFSQEWPQAVLLLWSAAFAFCVSETLCKKQAMALFVLSVINLLNVFGHNTVLHFETNLLDAVSDDAACKGYYVFTKVPNHLCSGKHYLGYLYFFAPVVMLLQFLIAVLAYMATCEGCDDDGTLIDHGIPQAVPKTKEESESSYTAPTEDYHAVAPPEPEQSYQSDAAGYQSLQ